MTFLLSTLEALFLLGTALVFGGTAALSFAVAPRLFQTLPAEDAERSFGRVLAVFDGVATVAALVAFLAGGLGVLLTRAWLPGAPATGAVGLAAAILLWLRRGLAPRMARVGPPGPGAGGRAAWSPEGRAAFDRLHLLYVKAYATNLLLTAAALTLTALA
jgi:hypothetical protein